MTSQLKDASLLREAAYVNGQWLSESPHGRYELRNPATGAVLASLPRLQQAEADAAIIFAHQVFLGWKCTTAAERGRLLLRWFGLIHEHRDDLARLITLEEGKPLREAQGELDYAASFVEWFAEEAKRTYGEVIPAPKPQQNIVVLTEPVGVCAAITPWNFPAAMVTRKVAPALAAGCTIVLKPASQTPLTALALAELAIRAGLPAGAFSVLTGNDTGILGETLTRHPLVRKVTFTGSTEVGRVLLRQAADGIKNCSMELGGNAPFIVFDDADLDRAVEGVMAAKFRNTGQSCIGANRILVQANIHDAFAERVVERVRQLKVGNGLEPDTDIGPLISSKAVSTLRKQIEGAVSAGARVLTGGGVHACGDAFLEPAVIADVTPTMALSCEEIFGPVMPLLRFQDEQEAIAMANDTEYGLAAYFYSRDHARIWRVAKAIGSGMVGINTGLISNAVAPFGGVKQSGLGREGSRHGIEEFMEKKYLCWDEH
ncbi:MAG: NAD-dependent succinate-semialdehyde dehydrogenase [Spongiibacteraceae bacterium]|nr:NAD-dependent succinate-semialdehyde dehydrogenase [Spongiibacteraceae bacterium]